MIDPKDILNFILRKLFIDGHARPFIEQFPECALPTEMFIDRMHFSVSEDELAKWARVCRGRKHDYEAEILERAIAHNGKMILSDTLIPSTLTAELEAMLAEYLGSAS